MVKFQLSVSIYRRQTDSSRVPISERCFADMANIAFNSAVECDASCGIVSVKWVVPSTASNHG